MRTMLRSKIHRATVTDANLEYEGSISIDSRLLKAADIIPYEKVSVLNVSNGARFDTYALEGKDNEICVNGAAARLAAKGDVVIIVTYCDLADDEAKRHVPRVILLDSNNVQKKK